jgi:hypothetical protein
MMEFILRVSEPFQSALVLRILYESLVWSILEFSSIIWSPSNRAHCLKLERVQKRSLRFLYAKLYRRYPWLYPNAFLLGALGFNYLESHRQLYLGKHFHKLLIGLVHNPQILDELDFDVSTESI